MSSALKIAPFLAPILLALGCARTQRYVIDTAPAKPFHWDGTLRLVEYHTLGFLFSPSRTTYSIELPGHGNRRVSVTPRSAEHSEFPKAQILGGAADNTLRIMTGPVISSAIIAGGAGQERDLPVSRVHTFHAHEAVPSSAPVPAFELGAFGKVSAPQALAAAIASAKEISMTYRLANGHTLRAEINPEPPGHLSATIIDATGKVLHQYAPVDLHPVN